jgi:hypothetical protein
MSAANFERLGVGKGDGVVLRSEVGELRGRVQIAPIAKSANLQVHWSEGNALIADERRSPEAGYNAWSRSSRRPSPGLS